MFDDAEILSIDVEKNGLHGIVFAVGAVLLSRDGSVLESFRARCPVQGEPRDFVRREVLPALEAFPITHSSAESLRAEFWHWFVGARKHAHIFADCGWPSEARFFIALADDDRETRYLNGPFPLNEIATLLLAVGEDPHTNREEYAREYLGDRSGQRHHPWWDAYVSGLCAIKAFRAIETKSSLTSPLVTTFNDPNRDA